MGSKQGNTTTSTTPWSGQEPALRYQLSEAMRLYQQKAPPQFFPYQTVAPLMNPFTSAAMGSVNLGDQYLDNIYKNVESKVMPSISSADAMAGRTPAGSGTFAENAARGLTEAYAPFAQNQANLNWQRAYGLGQDVRSYQQALLQDAINRWSYNQNLPWEQLARLQGGINIGSGYSSTTNPYYTNPVGGALSGGLGGAVSGAMLGSVVPGIGTGIGALAGGLMGGAGGLFGSSREYKEDIRPLRGKSALKMLGDLDIASWKYRRETPFHDDKTHYSPMAEDWQEATGLGDGRTIDLRDQVGLLMAGNAELIRRIKELESAIGAKRKKGSY